MSSPSDKRRGGGGSHVLRTGNTSSTHRQHKEKEASGHHGAGAGGMGSSMPTPPPKAAVNAGGPEEPSHEGGAALQDKEEKRDAHTKSTRESQELNSPGPSRATSLASRSSSNKARSKDREVYQQELREKDERIAYLEKEMGVMEREFSRQLDKLSQNESETATFWQGKHSALNQQFLRTDTDLRMLRSEVESKDNERDELRRGWDMLRRELRERDEEIRGLRGQVRGLKEFVSTSTRTDGQQTSDEVFGDGMTRLGNGLQNWVITNFRKAKTDLSKVDKATMTELSDLVPMFEELAQTSKVHLLQSVVSSILVDMVFNAYYVGLSEEQTSLFRNMEELLLSFTDSVEPVNQWRASTLSILRREATQRLADSADPTNAVVSRINRILDSITSPSTSAAAQSTSTTSPSEARDAALRVLVNNSIELARLLVVQKAVLKVYFPRLVPHQQVFFDAESMEDMGGEDEEALSEREICCVAFPGVIKQGDENGGHLQYRNIITKARVLCSPEEQSG